MLKRASRRFARRSNGRTTSSPTTRSRCSHGFRSSRAGCTLDAADEIVAADVDGLQSLVDKSLRAARPANGSGCWRRSGSSPRERLAASDDADAIGRRHAEWFLALAEEAEPFLKGAEQRFVAATPGGRARQPPREPRLVLRPRRCRRRGEARRGRCGCSGTCTATSRRPAAGCGERSTLPRTSRRRPAPRCSTAPATSPAEQNENEEALALLEASFACAKEVGATATAAIAAAVLVPHPGRGQQ